MKLQLSAVDGTFHDKEECKPQRDFLPEPVELDLQDENALHDFFKSKVHSVWQYIGIRCRENTTAMLAIAHDFDGGEKTFEQRVEQFKNSAGIVYTSSSHTEKHPKVRVIQVLKKPIVDRARMESVCEWLKQQYPDADTKVYRISQPLFPCCQYDNNMKTTGFPLFQLQVLIGKKFSFPAEAFKIKVEKARRNTGEWQAPSDQFTEKNQRELDLVMAYYNDYPIKKGSRDEELVRLCAKYRQCGCTENETFKALCVINRDYVQPPYEETGFGGGDKTIEQIVDHVFTNDIHPPAPENWSTLQAAIDAAKEQPKTDDESLDALIEAASGANIRTMAPAQCFAVDEQDNGTLYYLVGNDKMQMLVGQGLTYFHRNKTEQYGIKLRDVIPVMRFKNVGAYLGNERQVRPAQIFHDIRKYLTDYLILTQPLNYSYLALWIMGTYSYVAWDAYPYISVRGEIASGKTTVLERVASLAFNANNPSGMTAAALFHTVTTDAGTICVDEAEKLQGKDRKEGSVDVLEILNLGYKATGSTMKMERVKGGNWAIKRFCCYSPKMLAGVGRLAPTLRSRCHEIQMQPLLPEEIERLHKYQSSRASIKDCEDRIRNDLYIFTLQHFFNPPSVSPAAADIVGRHFELWNPIFFYADMVDADNGNDAITDEMSKLAALSSQATIDAVGKDDLNLKLLIALRDMFADESVKSVTNAAFNNDEMVYIVDTVYEYLRTRPEFSWLDEEGSKKNWLTRAVTVDLEFKADRRRVRVGSWASDSAVRLYRFNKAQFADTVARRISVTPSDLTNDSNTKERNT